MPYFIIYNKTSGEQVYSILDDNTGSYNMYGGTLVWDEPVDGDAINESATPWTDQQLIANIGRFTRQTSPSLHLLSGGYIAGHLAAVESTYKKTIETWQLKFELHARALLSTCDSAITATYATDPLNKIRWEQKKYIDYNGAISDLIKTELSYTTTQMIELFDKASLWATEV